MKKKIVSRLQQRLFDLSRQTLERYHPIVVAITGSVGKTSTKDAIATVLAAKFSVRASSGNYNNEIGVPLTILGEDSPGKSVIGWWRLLRRAKKVAAGHDSNYPHVLVLEMAMDRPGDLAKLVALAKPATSVVTGVSESHLEFFTSISAIAAEKATLIKALAPEGTAIVNADNKLSADMRRLHPGKTLTFGIDAADADVTATDLQFLMQLSPGTSHNRDTELLEAAGMPLGMTFKAEFEKTSVPMRLPRALGRQQVYSALAAIAVGLAHGMNLVEISDALLKFVPPKGRTTLIPGIKNTMLIDDTYNASPVSTIAALNVLAAMKTGGRRIAILGDMAELGERTEPGHREVGTHAAKTSNFAIFVGPKMKFAGEAADEAGMTDERHTEVLDARQVEDVIQPKLEAGDVVLIKGSQSMRMERVVKSLMAEPERAAELLVRQTGLWENKA